MSRSEATGFLDQIRAHPEDDAPRLVYADWLDERGDSPRAEFIRVQIERAALPTWDVRQVALQLREKALLSQHRDPWRKELPVIDGVTWGEFRRGFVATAQIDAFRLLGSKAKAVWAAAPIEAVAVRWPQQGERSEDISPIPNLRELSITRRLVDVKDIARLAAAPLLSTLRTLTIADVSLGPDAFRRLCNSPHLKGLTALRVPENSIGNPGVRDLVQSGALSALTELDLSEKAGAGRYGEDPIVDLTAARICRLARRPGCTH